MKEIDKDDLPDASGGLSDWGIPVPAPEPTCPVPFPDITDPLGDRRKPLPWECPGIDS